MNSDEGDLQTARSEIQQRLVAYQKDDHAREQTLGVARRILEQEQEAARKLDGLLEPIAEFEPRALGAAA